MTPPEPQIKPGVKLMVEDVSGHRLPRIATSGVESAGRQPDGSYHDFAVVWVRPTGIRESVPWPLEDVRLADA